ncbi:hypothetical protein [Alicyclobacillus suci]|uniref:hypothetical protein n=1 Tax=Alicyclobacillus suci TaxID=2816080 RepID=UPI001A8FB8A0|nr:hypothetical protein [Alicyclobacillus suci]
MVSSVEVQILEDVISAFGLAIGGGITYLTTKVVPKYIHSKTAQNAIDGLANIANAVVQQFNQTVVSDAKSAGVFNAQLAAQVKKDAVAAVMLQGSNLVALAQKSVGDVESLVGALVEQAVAGNKTLTTGTALVNAPAPAQQEQTSPTGDGQAAATTA